MSSTPLILRVLSAYGQCKTWIGVISMNSSSPSYIAFSDFSIEILTSSSSSVERLLSLSVCYIKRNSRRQQQINNQQIFIPDRQMHRSVTLKKVNINFESCQPCAKYCVSHMHFVPIPTQTNPVPHIDSYKPHTICYYTPCRCRGR